MNNIKEDNVEDICKCGNDADDLHTCPYKEDINGDYESLCNCCSACRNECAKDI